MTSRFRADIRIDMAESSRAVYDAMSVDNSYYDGPDNVSVTFDGAIRVRVEAARLPHLRAGINSVLRLARAGHGAVESVKL